MSASFEGVATALAAVAATTKRNAKRDHLAAVLGSADRDELPVVVGMLTGRLRQGRIGIGWATLRGIGASRAEVATTTVGDLDRSLTELAAIAGPGSRRRRADALDALFGRLTALEADLAIRLLGGEVRTGALDGVVTDAIAVAAALPAPAVRRAAMLTGSLAETADLALFEGPEAIDAVRLEVLRPVLPMLAATAASVADAVEGLGTVRVEWKLDGARIQVHRDGAQVRIVTRNLHDVTDRLPTVVSRVLTYPAERFVLDGEILGLSEDDAPGAFRDSMSSFRADSPPAAGPAASAAGASAGAVGPTLQARYFDLLACGDDSLIDRPLAERRRLLDGLVGGDAVPGTTTDDVAAAEAVLEEAIRLGHEGVMVKAADGRYEAGRRGTGWRKVKPVHTLDLVVLAVEPGSGRRAGTLSNIHLGALDVPGGIPVMVGKTFKGMSDEMLAWQTTRFTELAVDAIGDDPARWPRVVHLHPAQVVEVALDGAQVSTRYPGGVALRFARVVRYRDDKAPSQADALDAIRALLPRTR